MNILWFWLLRF